MTPSTSGPSDVAKTRMPRGAANVLACALQLPRAPTARARASRWRRPRCSARLRSSRLTSRVAPSRWAPMPPRSGETDPRKLACCPRGRAVDLARCPPVHPAARKVTPLRNARRCHNHRRRRPHKSRWRGSSRARRSRRASSHACGTRMRCVASGPRGTSEVASNDATEDFTPSFHAKRGASAGASA